MTFTENLKKRVSKATVLLMTAVTLGQSLIAPVQVFADELESGQETVTNVTQDKENPVTPNEEAVQKLKEITDNPALTEAEKTETIYSVFEGMDRVKYGYTDEAGKQVTVQEESLISTFAALDDSEYTPYSFRVDLNGYWAEGQMPVLKMDGEVVFCIEPGIAVQAGEGYNPMDLPLNITTQMTRIGAIGYNPNPTHERYVAAQGYIWELMGSSFSTSYAGYNAMKNQIDTDIANYYIKPSFSDQTVTVKMGEPLTLTDTNGVLPEFVDDVSTGGLKITKNGNQLTLEADANTADTAVVEMWKLEQGGTSIAYQKQGAQTTAKFALDDPARFKLNVDVIKMGDAEFQKLSEFSNLPMEGVKYSVTETGKAPYEMVTDAEGMLKFPERLHDTVITVTEIENPIGWVLDPNTYELTIEGGTTVSRTLVNELQMGGVKLKKNQTVLDEQASKEQGQPVYKKVPLAGAEFDLVAENDILLPDGKTVYVQAGTVVDSFVTDENGEASSTRKFLIGKDNFYRLVETNVPEGYRAPSEDQTLFSIPNGNNTEKLIQYDMGIIDNELKTGRLDFFKRDALDLTGIDGAQFTVEMMSGLYRGFYFTFETKATGNNFELPAGDWRLTEVKLPNGYEMDPGTPQTQWVTIVDNERIELNWNNKKVQPNVGISTQAHIGDGVTNTFTWGDNVTFYDDSQLTHENIPAGTERAYETKLHAIYADGTTAIVWASGLVDYTVTDKVMTETVIAEYDYKNDPKATPETKYYFSEDGYNKPTDKEYKKDTEHNPDGKDPKQMITPVVKGTPTTPTTPNKSTGSFPNTGEQVGIAGMIIGSMMIVTLLGYFALEARKKIAAEKE